MTLMAWIFAALAVASIGSILVGRPWTIPLGRRSTPPAVWSTDIFRETNVVLTALWAFLFAGAAILDVTAPWWIRLAYGGVLAVLARRSTDIGLWYSARRLRAMSASQ